MTYNEWQSSGFQPLTQRNEEFGKLLRSNIAFVTIPTGWVV